MTDTKTSDIKDALAWRYFVICGRDKPIEECRKFIDELGEMHGNLIKVQSEIERMEFEKKTNSRFQEGSWVLFRHGNETKYGVIASRNGDDVTVNLAHGTETVPRWALEQGSPGAYFTQIADRAYKALDWKDGDIWKVHAPIANGREKLSFEVLAELDRYLSRLATSKAAAESWPAIEAAAEAMNAEAGMMMNEPAPDVNAPALLVNDSPEAVNDPAEEVDLFAAFGIGDLEPIDPKPELDSAKSVDGDAVSSDCAISAPSANDVSECASTADGVGDEGVITVNDKPMLPILERLGVTPEQMLDKLKASQEAAIREKYAHVSTDESGELVGDHGDKTINEIRQEQGLEPVRETQDVIRQELNQPLTVKGAGDYMVDPDTGEVLEESAILRTLGWTEYPKLSDEPSAAELDAFESKCDELTERINSYRDRTARWRRQAEERSAPLDKAADFWENFLRPLLKTLAPHRLPKYKSGKKAGQYRVKTLKLASGSWKFTQVGGINVFDWSLVQKTIEKEGVEKHSDYAKTEVKVNGKKFLALARDGKVRADFPGLKLTEANPLGKVSNATKGDTTSEDDDE